MIILLESLIMILIQNAIIMIMNTGKDMIVIMVTAVHTDATKHTA